MSAPPPDLLDGDQDIAVTRGPAWCQRTTAHIGHLQAQLNRIRTYQLNAPERELANKIETHLQTARKSAVAADWSQFQRWAGRPEDRTFSNIHKAEVKLLKLASGEELSWFGPTVLAQARQHLGVNDPRREILESNLVRNGKKLTPELREIAVGTLLAAHDAEETERARVRSFRNILAVAACVAGIVAASFVFWGYFRPSILPPSLCFNPIQRQGAQVCPLGGAPDGNDVAIVEAAGLAAAVLAGALSIRHIQGTSTPQSGYSVPVLLVLLRVPVGALSALLGILLIHGKFIPGLSDLDTGPQIIAWAISFGIIQESLTRTIDRQGQRVLENARDSARGFEER